MNGFITFEQAEELTGRTQSAIRSAVSRGKLKQHTVLGHKALKRNEVEKWSASAKVGRPKKEV